MDDCLEDDIGDAVVIVPSPSHYAAIRINPTAMLECLGLCDDATLGEAKRLKTKKYLAYLYWPAELPLPDMRWCRYNIELISNQLRKPDPVEGFTPDMVYPIAPNTSHPAGREPIYPTSTRPFPFPNCYHWMDNRATVRIRIPPGFFRHHDGLFSLSGEQQVALNKKIEEDNERICAYLLEEQRKQKAESSQWPQLPTASSEPNTPETATNAPETAPNAPETAPNTPETVPNTDETASNTTEAAPEPQTPEDLLHKFITAAYLEIVKKEGAMTSAPWPSRGDSGYYSEGSDTDSVSEGCSLSVLPAPSTSWVSELDDVFGHLPDPATGLIPLVDAWMEIDQHLTADTIPSRDELDEEARQMLRITKRGIIRRILLGDVKSVGPLSESVKAAARRALAVSIPPTPILKPSSVPIVIGHPALWNSHVGHKWVNLFLIWRVDEKPWTGFHRTLHGVTRASWTPPS